jgi:hypothetical protein
MLGEGMRFASSLALTTTELVADSAKAVFGDDLIEIRPRQFRRLLLTFEDSIHGQIPEILGDDEAERIDTLVSLLRGTSQQDMTKLIGALQQALIRLDEEERQAAVRTPTTRHADRHEHRRSIERREARRR